MFTKHALRAWPYAKHFVHFINLHDNPNTMKLTAAFPDHPFYSSLYQLSIAG